MKKPKVLQTFGNGKIFHPSMKAKMPINARDMDGKINFFLLRIPKILKFLISFFVIFLVFKHI